MDANGIADLKRIWVATAIAVIVVALMVGFIGGTDSLTSDIGRVVGSFQAHPPQSATGGYVMIEDGPSVCCEGFYSGGRIALAFVLLGGIPLAVLGLVLARRTSRARGETWATRWEPLVRWCLVFQLMNLILAGFLVVIVVYVLYDLSSTGPLDIGMSGFPVFLVANVAMSALAVRSWRAVQRSTRASENIEIGR